MPGLVENVPGLIQRLRQLFLSCHSEDQRYQGQLDLRDALAKYKIRHDERNRQVPGQSVEHPGFPDELCHLEAQTSCDEAGLRVSISQKVYAGHGLWLKPHAFLRFLRVVWSLNELPGQVQWTVAPHEA